jgi:leader peptidase (prepilin peptidase) / N-methyltransferase
MIILIYFINISLFISYVDIKKSLIPDKIIIPAIFGLVALKWLDGSLNLYDFVAMIIVLMIFVIPIMINMAFGGGDLRFGAFCALFLGIEQVGLFVLFAGVFHLLILSLLKKESYGFAPAMSLSALLAYMIGSL